jgi:hypothetical protein
LDSSGALQDVRTQIVAHPKQPFEGKYVFAFDDGNYPVDADLRAWVFNDETEEWEVKATIEGAANHWYAKDSDGERYEAQWKGEMRRTSPAPFKVYSVYLIEGNNYPVDDQGRVWGLYTRETRWRTIGTVSETSDGPLAIDNSGNRFEAEKVR